MDTLALTPLIAACGGLTLWAEHRGRRAAFYVLKPLTTALILALAAAALDPVTSAYQRMVCVGLLFSLVGDVFLMLPRDRFVAGLASFLIAHLFYIAAFTSRGARLAVPVVLLALLAYGGWLLRALWPRLGGLRGPVAVYAAVLLAMAWQAWARWAAVDTVSALLAALGAGWFVVSDSVLAWERFRERHAYGQAVVLGTYYTAQWLIAASVYSAPFR